MRRVAILIVCCCATPTQASLLLYDGFEYTPGAVLAPTTDTTGSPNPGQLNVAYSTNWRYAGAGNASTQKAPGIASGSLDSPFVVPSTGNSVTFDSTQTGTSRINLSAIQSSGTVYWSGLLRVNDVGTLGTANAGGPFLNGYLVGGLNNAQGPGGAPGTVVADLRIRGDAADSNRYFIGVATNSGTTAPNIQFEPSSRAESATTVVLVVAAYTFVPGASNDTAQMWINPDPSTFGALTAPAATLTSNPLQADSAANVQSFNLRQVSTVGVPNFQFDELRVGTTWADVTPIPEPGAMLLLGAVCGFGLAWQKGIRPWVKRLASLPR